MKNFWKTLGVTALVIGLTPYRVTMDKASGCKKIQALLWKATCGRSGSRDLSVDFGFFPPNEDDEPHLFADELVVHYHNGQPCCADEETCCCQNADPAQEGTCAHSQWQAPETAVENDQTSAVTSTSPESSQEASQESAAQPQEP